jgi:hypothetical protein
MRRWTISGLLIFIPSFTCSTFAIISEDAEVSSAPTKKINPKLRKQEDSASAPSSSRTVSISAHGEEVHQASETEGDKPKSKHNTYFFKVHRPEKDAPLTSLYESGNTVSELQEEHDKIQEDDEFDSMFEELTSTGGCPETLVPLEPRESSQRLDDLEHYPVACDKNAGQYLSSWKMSTGGTANKLQMSYSCCIFADKLAVDQCTTGSKTFGNADGSIMNLVSNTGDQNKIGCSTAAEGALTDWKLVKSGESVVIDYTCCPLDPAGQQFTSPCKDAESDVQSEDFMLKGLRKHQLACEHGHAMMNWEMYKTGDKFQLKWNCCPVGNVVEMNPTPKTCCWVGDPHYNTFDGVTHHPMRPTGGYYWVVKTDTVQIQSYYQSAHGTDPMRTRGIAVAGKFLLGNKLVVRYDVAELKTSGSAKSYRTGGLTKEILWNGNIVDNGGNWQSAEMDGKVNLQRTGSKEYLNLPMGMKLDVTQYSYYEDQCLTAMKIGKKDYGGQCGVFTK